MLCAPVTKLAAAFQVCAKMYPVGQFDERYFRLPPTVRQPSHDVGTRLPLRSKICADCSCTRTMFLVGLPGRSEYPHCEIYVPKPASRSSLLVAGAVYFTCCTFWCVEA